MNTNNTWRVLLVIVCISIFAGISTAQENRIRKLGTTNAFFSGSLVTPADLKKLRTLRQADITLILQKRGWRGNLEDLWRMMESGPVTETVIESGAEIPFMSARVDGRPTYFDRVVWVGNHSFKAYVLAFDSNGYRHRFYFPKVCANFWYEEAALAPPVVEKPEPRITITAGEVCVTQPGNLQIQVANADGRDVTLVVDGQALEPFRATEGNSQRQLAPFAEPGSHQITATLGTQQASAVLIVKPCPPVCSLVATPVVTDAGRAVVLDASGSRVGDGMPGRIRTVNVVAYRGEEEIESFELTQPSYRAEVVLRKKGSYSLRARAIDEAGQQSTNVCDAALEIQGSRMAFFLAALGGKERLIQDDEDFQGARCAGLAGVKFGVLPRLGENAELEISAGGKINMEDGGNSSVFVDTAIHGLFGAGFVGAGVSFWDLTEEDTRAVAALFQLGFALSNRVHFLAEGRIPFDRFDDTGNNYQFWGGLRILFGN